MTMNGLVMDVFFPTEECRCLQLKGMLMYKRVQQILQHIFWGESFGAVRLSWSIDIGKELFVGFRRLVSTKLPERIRILKMIGICVVRRSKCSLLNHAKWLANQKNSWLFATMTNLRWEHDQPQTGKKSWFLCFFWLRKNSHPKESGTCQWARGRSSETEIWPLKPFVETRQKTLGRKKQLLSFPGVSALS